MAFLEGGYSSSPLPSPPSLPTLSLLQDSKGLGFKPRIVVCAFSLFPVLHSLFPSPAALSLAFTAHWLVGVGFDAALRIHKLGAQRSASADDVSAELRGALSRASREAVRQVVILVCSAVTASVVVYTVGRQGHLSTVYHIGRDPHSCVLRGL